MERKHKGFLKFYYGHGDTPTKMTNISMKWNHRRAMRRELCTQELISHTVEESTGHFTIVHSHPFSLTFSTMKTGQLKANPPDSLGISGENFFLLRQVPGLPLPSPWITVLMTARFMPAWRRGEDILEAVSSSQWTSPPPASMLYSK